MHQTDGKKDPVNGDNIRWGEKMKKETRADPQLLNSYFYLKSRRENNTEDDEWKQRIATAQDEIRIHEPIFYGEGNGMRNNFVNSRMTMWNDYDCQRRWADLVAGCHWTIHLPTVISGECYRPNGGGRSVFQDAWKGASVSNDDWARRLIIEQLTTTGMINFPILYPNCVNRLVVVATRGPFIYGGVSPVYGGFSPVKWIPLEQSISFRLS